MSILYKISSTAFQNMELEAGMMLTAFNPASPAEPTDDEIVCATTGGLTITCTPTYTDFGEDVDNCPNNMLEYKHLDSWECTIAGTALDMSPTMLAEFLGAASVDGTDSTKVTLDGPGMVASARFKDRWWAGETAGGGIVAVHLKNALCTSGLSLTTSKSGKGNLSFTYTGHVSVDAQDEMPMEFYATTSSST